MRIALVVTGGVDRSGRQFVIPTLLSLVERLARRHDVIVYVLRHEARACSYPLLGAMVRDLGRPNGIRRQYQTLVDAMRRDGHFDVVHGYWAIPAGFVAAAAGRRLGIPAVVTCDSGEFIAIPDIGYGAQLRARQRAVVAATKWMARVITVCTTYQADLAGRYRRDVRIIPLGVDCDRFVPAERREGPPWRLLHVASVNPVKDHVTLLRAFRSLLNSGVPAHLDLVGVDTLAGAAARLATELQIDQHLTFQGFRPTAELIPLYQQSHAFVLTSRHEAAGAVVLEAAACGVPVAGSAVGYIKDWSPDRSMAISPQQPDQLGQALHRLLGDHALRDRLARNAREWTLAHDADWTASQFTSLYEETAHR